MIPNFVCEVSHTGCDHTALVTSSPSLQSAQLPPWCPTLSALPAFLPPHPDLPSAHSSSVPLCTSPRINPRLIYYIPKPN